MELKKQDILHRLEEDPAITQIKFMREFDLSRKRIVKEITVKGEQRYARIRVYDRTKAD